MPQSFCTVCRRRIPKGSRCKAHAIKSPSNRAWHEPGALLVRAAVLERDGHACVRCGSAECLEVHHKVPARAGGSTSLENLVTLCFDCHLGAERGDYAR
jgi:5-methylcytosine-specific restriction endonuclease McrA